MAKDKKTTEREKIKKAPKVSANLQKIIDQIEKLSVIELSDLVKALEEKFGVSATAVAPVAAPVGQALTAEGAPGAAAEEKSEFNVILASAGANKIAVIKALRDIKPELGLKEAKDLTESAPKEVLTGVKKEVAEEAKKKLEEAGAQVELK